MLLLLTLNIGNVTDSGAVIDYTLQHDWELVSSYTVFILKAYKCTICGFLRDIIQALGFLKPICGSGFRGNLTREEIGHYQWILHFLCVSFCTLSSSTQQRYIPLSESDYLFRYNILGRPDKRKSVFMCYRKLF